MDVHSEELPIFRQPRFGDYLVGICGEGIEWALKLNCPRFQTLKPPFDYYKFEIGETEVPRGRESLT